MLKRLTFLFAGFFLFALAQAQYKMEFLTRGVHAVPAGNGKIFVSWRLLGTEDNSLAFNLYRTANGKTIKLNTEPLVNSTNYTDDKADTAQTNIYTVKAIINKNEEPEGNSFSLTANAKPYISILL